MTILRELLRRLVTPLIRDAVNDLRLRVPLIHGPADRVYIHPTARVQNATINVASGCVTVEEHAFFGHGVALRTGRHRTELTGRERQTEVVPGGCDIVVRRGAWIASGAIVVGPCVIGKHAVVAAGSVVVDDVPAGCVVAGNPARIVKRDVASAKESKP